MRRPVVFGYGRTREDPPRRRVRLGVVVLLVALAAAILAPLPADAAHPGRAWVREVIADRARAHGVSPWLMTAIADCESELDPGAVGDRGLSLGLYQLHRDGLRPAFFRLGYGNVWSVWEQADFAARMVAEGYASHWSCFRLISQRGGW